jgi:addiction module HigA family antidote
MRTAWKSWITIETHMKSKQLANITPGEILQEDFLKPLGMSQYRVAMDIGVPLRRINEIVKGQRAVTADTALRLGRYFQMSAQFWLNLQPRYDLEKEVKVLAAA